MTLVRRPSRRAGDRQRSRRRARSPATTADGAQVAAASRIWVEGRHDAELVEHVWGDDLRELGIVVEPMHGIDDLVGAGRRVRAATARRLGDARRPPRRRIEGVAPRGHGRARPTCSSRVIRSSTCGRASGPGCSASTAWPDVPRGVPWKDGMCRALGADPTRFWPQLRNRVRTYADLRPELVGAVERLIDFVSA